MPRRINMNERLGMVMPTCNSNYAGGEHRRVTILAQPGKKLARLHLKNKPDMVAYTCDPSYLGGRGKRMTV
jgi:hypothetical protein